MKYFICIFEISYSVCKTALITICTVIPPSFPRGRTVSYALSGCVHHHKERTPVQSLTPLRRLCDNARRR